MKQVAKPIEVGFVAIDPKTGNILALVGGRNTKNFKYGLNHVTQIRRQPGSAFKPFVYTVAIDNGYPPCFEIQNLPVTIMMADGTRWTPSNSDGEFGGKMTIREAIKHSVNIVAVRTMDQKFAPVNQVIDYARRMGITSPLPPYASLALGAGEVTPLELTGAFGVLCQSRCLCPADLDPEDRGQGRDCARREPPCTARGAQRGNVVHHDFDARGRCQRRYRRHVRDFFQLPAAGKTGTTTDFADAWFVGYTPQIVAGVWVGFDNNSVHFKTWDGQGGRRCSADLGTVHEVRL